jgi:hypothetical protein
MERKGECRREWACFPPAGEQWRGSPRLVTILVGLLLTLAGCAAASTTDDVIDAYPSKSLASLFKDSNSPPPPPTSGGTAPATSSTAATATAATGPRPTMSSNSGPTAAVSPARSTSSEDADAVAAAYPSVPLFGSSTSATPASH